MLRGAIAAAVTPLREGGAALDEDAFGSYRLPRAAGLDGSSRSGRPARGSCCRRRAPARGRAFIEAAAALRGRCALRRPDDRGHRGARGARGRGGRRRRRGDRRRRTTPRRATRCSRTSPRRRGRARRCRSTSTSSPRAAATRCRWRCVERLRERGPNLAGLKVSDTAVGQVRPYLIEGLDVFVGPEALILAGARGRCGRRGLGAGGGVPGATSPRRARAGEGDRARERARCGRALPVPGGAEVRARPCAACRSGEDVRRPLRQLSDDEREELRGWLESS